MNINNEFYEEFKKLDKLLSEAYGELHGVTAYLNDMKKRGVVDVGDYNKLKKLRHIRNNLAHEVGYGNIDRVTKEDILYIKNFKKRFLKGKDPLAQIKSKPNSRLIAFFIALLVVLSIFIGVLINNLLG